MFLLLLDAEPTGMNWFPSAPRAGAVRAQPLPQKGEEHWEKLNLCPKNGRSTGKSPAESLCFDHEVVLWKQELVGKEPVHNHPFIPNLAQCFPIFA